MDMFYNYDNNIEQKLDQICPPLPMFTGPASSSNIALIYNIKDEPLGVEVKYGMPFTLYFNLVSSCGCPLLDLISNCTVCFKILTTNHKVVFSKELLATEIFNSDTNDLIISISQAEAKMLKQETYKLQLSLFGFEGEYVIYSEKDGVLCIR